METPIYSHNPYHTTQFPLLVLDVRRQVCAPYNEGFRVLHWHEEVQFVYVLKGVVHVKVYDEELDLERNDCIFINKSVLHLITEKEDCQYHSYIIPPRMLSFFPGSIMEEKDVSALINDPSFTHYVLRAGNSAHQSVLREIRHLDELYFQNVETKHREYRISIQLAQLWLSFISLHPEKEISIASQNFERIRALITFVHTNYQRPISVQDIADEAHISKTECVRCFRRFIGDSPYQYLIKYRLHVSTSLLTTTNMSVTDVALHVGFGSVSSYIKYFKQHYHTTPYRYRAENTDEGETGNDTLV